MWWFLFVNTEPATLPRTSPNTDPAIRFWPILRSLIGDKPPETTLRRTRPSGPLVGIHGRRERSRCGGSPVRKIEMGPWWRRRWRQWLMNFLEWKWVNFDERVLQKHLSAPPVLGILNKALFQKVLSLLRQFFWNLWQFFSHTNPNQQWPNTRPVANVPRGFSGHHLHDGTSQGPDIRRRLVLIVVHRFRRHKQRRSPELALPLFLPLLLGEPEVRDFHLAVVENENVLELHVAVNETVVVNMFESFHDGPSASPH